MNRSTQRAIALLAPLALLAASARAADPTPATRTTMTTTTTADAWSAVCNGPDPTAPLLAQFRRDARGREVLATGLRRADYLRLIAGNVDFWKSHQDAHGAIIDPDRGEEWQYSTPCYALAAVTLVARAGRDDLLESAARAMDWSCERLAKREGATKHEDFYPPPLAHALPLFKGRVDAKRYDAWTAELASVDPFAIYRAAIGHNNWNVVSLSGEYRFHTLGIRPSLDYVEQSLAAQGKFFAHPFGLYTEGPMAYDLFPRMWADDLIAAGYGGRFAALLRAVLRRGAITSLFMQSPIGEWPTGGRSAQHQWNEAEECATFEMHAARGAADGDVELAGTFKRAAHLALASMFRWQRPTGELFIVKNRAEPAVRHGYEVYSGHSQYNLLAMAMLAIAHEQAAATDDVAERPAPADVGGFVLDLRERFGKVIANAGGTYVEVETAADPTHNPTGLLRVHRAGLASAIGPSDGLSAKTIELYPTTRPGRAIADKAPPVTAAVGPAWRLADGTWRSLAEFDAKRLTSAELRDVASSPDRVAFRIVYHADFGGPSSVVERYELTRDGVVRLSAELVDYAGPTRMIVPLLAHDGAAGTAITVDADRVTVRLGADAQSFAAPGATTIAAGDDWHAFRNGWARLGTAEFAGNRATLVIGPPSEK